MTTFSRDDIDKFWRKQTTVKDPRVATHFKKDDAHLFDITLVRNYIKPNSRVLDLGCGTCVIANEISAEVAKIVAVDKYNEFLSYCRTSNKIVPIEADLLSYDPGKNNFDLILFFGIMNYFSDQDVKGMYARASQALKKDGVLIVKHASGINGDVEVDKYSKQIGDVYRAIYRGIDHDKSLLQQFFSQITIEDIYPPRLNRWDNTHYYAYICKK